MIVIDGNQSNLQVNNFQNLEELLVKAMTEEPLSGRIITDVIVNDEAFSEIYPHQAEDIEASEIESVQIQSVPVGDMAVDITRELYKVIRLMSEGGKRVAEMFRQADDAEALEMYQDLLDVTRDFLTMVGVLRNEFSLEMSESLNKASSEISGLFTEMVEVMENEDWILLADLLEYEFMPAVDRWKQVVADLRETIRGSKEQ